ncbi:thioesterase family protein [Denitrificimonas sp. JX-1]|uniref:Thioesterase family protein n=1 Tax=Denitrificimonas halotolerans TaxID=3098930 RepID=A0ABU5GR33_9GAMM|nr:thioesterase family protein [Denitrificimonas sp. JX-1]MDY7218835.1 thioesterase family protein [Denitrificimonas sp. JX-1]
MRWDYPNPFILPICASAAEIDEFDHVNNAVYVQWMEECAWQHSIELGLGFAEYQALDRGMAILRHEIDYLASAYEGEQMEMATWVAYSDQRLKMDRYFQLRRVADGQTLLRAKTTFVCIELSSGRPKRMPPAFVQGYGAAMLPEHARPTTV